MSSNSKPRLAAAALLLAAICGAPALADVKAGVDAWSRGNYAAAVNQWEGPASAGDADAMFNLAQAYRLGRGVPRDMGRAEELYQKAAAAGHIQASDTYGLLLFQDGRREQALPYVENAARRGDPRSQYLLGIAHFNGDIVSRDWIRAYALVSLANAQGLPQAGAATREMDGHIPLDQRQKAAALAVELQREADAARARELAAAELGTQVAEASPPPQATPRVPRPIPSTAVSPSVAAARAAVAEARQATGTESPADAGATFARSEQAAPQAVASAAPARAQTAPVTPAPPAVPAPSSGPTAIASGPWRVQLGAFSVRGNADRLWSRLSGRAELSGKERLMVLAGGVTKLQVGGYASRATADAACRSLKATGQDCLVTRD